jgi:hypothetical protein
MGTRPGAGPEALTVTPFLAWADPKSRFPRVWVAVVLNSVAFSGMSTVKKIYCVLVLDKKLSVLRFREEYVADV